MCAPFLYLCLSSRRLHSATDFISFRLFMICSLYALHIHAYAVMLHVREAGQKKRFCVYKIIRIHFAAPSGSLRFYLDFFPSKNKMP